MCEDPAFFTPSVGQRLRALADFAASKYDVVDCVMHAKLLVALVTAKVRGWSVGLLVGWFGGGCAWNESCQQPWCQPFSHGTILFCTSCHCPAVRARP